jgi:hypothetical protein
MCTRVRCVRVNTLRELRCGWARDAPDGWAEIAATGKVRFLQRFNSKALVAHLDRVV